MVNYIVKEKIELMATDLERQLKKLVLWTLREEIEYMVNFHTEKVGVWAKE